MSPVSSPLQNITSDTRLERRKVAELVWPPGNLGQAAELVELLGTLLHHLPWSEIQGPELI